MKGTLRLSQGWGIQSWVQIAAWELRVRKPAGRDRRQSFMKIKTDTTREDWSLE